MPQAAGNKKRGNLLPQKAKRANKGSSGSRSSGGAPPAKRARSATAARKNAVQDAADDQANDDNSSSVQAVPQSLANSAVQAPSSSAQQQAQGVALQPPQANPVNFNPTLPPFNGLMFGANPAYAPNAMMFSQAIPSIPAAPPYLPQVPLSASQQAQANLLHALLLKQANMSVPLISRWAQMLGTTVVPSFSLHVEALPVSVYIPVTTSQGITLAPADETEEVWPPATVRWIISNWALLLEKLRTAKDTVMSAYTSVADALVVSAGREAFIEKSNQLMLDAEGELRRWVDYLNLADTDYRDKCKGLDMLVTELDTSTKLAQEKLQSMLMLTQDASADRQQQGQWGSVVKKWNEHVTGLIRVVNDSIHPSLRNKPDKARLAQCLKTVRDNVNATLGIDDKEPVFSDSDIYYIYYHHVMSPTLREEVKRRYELGGKRIAVWSILPTPAQLRTPDRVKDEVVYCSLFLAAYQDPVNVLIQAVNRSRVDPTGWLKDLFCKDRATVQAFVEEVTRRYHADFNNIEWQYRLISSLPDYETFVLASWQELQRRGEGQRLTVNPTAGDVPLIFKSPQQFADVYVSLLESGHSYFNGLKSSHGSGKHNNGNRDKSNSNGNGTNSKSTSRDRSNAALPARSLPTISSHSTSSNTQPVQRAPPASTTTPISISTSQSATGASGPNGTVTVPGSQRIAEYRHEYEEFLSKVDKKMRVHKWPTPEFDMMRETAKKAYNNAVFRRALDFGFCPKCLHMPELADNSHNFESCKQQHKTFKNGIDVSKVSPDLLRQSPLKNDQIIKKVQELTGITVNNSTKRASTTNATTSDITNPKY